jgi:drug/metabolite transporter (DMT)-like permease
VLLWSTGFLAGKAGVADSGPFHLVAIRFAIASVLLLSFALLTRAPWPKQSRDIFHIIIAGLLVHAGYIGAVFTALREGVTAGQIAMIVGLQPVLTALCASWLLKETVSLRRWIGLLTGLLGVGLVISPRLTHGFFTPEALLGMPAALFALGSISMGTLYQKRFCQGMDLRSGGAIQYAASALIIFFLIGADDPAPQWTMRFIFALTWLVLVLSVGAIGLLYRLLEQGEASKVVTYFYLVPPVTTFFGVILFGESFTLLTAIGTVLVSIAVAVAA